MPRLAFLATLLFYSCHMPITESGVKPPYDPTDLVFFYPREYSELSHVQVRRHIVERRAKELKILLAEEEWNSSWGNLREELEVAAEGDLDSWAWSEYGKEAQVVLDFYQKQLRENLVYQKCLLMDLGNEPLVELYLMRYKNKADAKRSFQSLLLGQNASALEAASKILCPKKLLSYLPQDGTNYGPWKLVDNSWCVAQTFEAQPSSAVDFFHPMVGELWVLYWSERYNDDSSIQD